MVQNRSFAVLAVHVLFLFVAYSALCSWARALPPREAVLAIAVTAVSIHNHVNTPFLGADRKRRAAYRRRVASWPLCPYRRYAIFTEEEAYRARKP